MLYILTTVQALLLRNVKSHHGSLMVQRTGHDNPGMVEGSDPVLKIRVASKGDIEFKVLYFCERVSRLCPDRRPAVLPFVCSSRHVCEANPLYYSGVEKYGRHFLGNVIVKL